MDRIATERRRSNTADVELKKQILTLVVNTRKDEYINPEKTIEECKKYFDFITSEEKEDESPYKKHKTS